jgi:hypothetical protein
LWLCRKVIAKLQTTFNTQRQQPRGRKEIVTSSVREFPRGYYCDVGTVKDNTLTWDVRIFGKLPNGLYQIHKYRFVENIYSVDRVKKALSKHFEILETRLIEKIRIAVFTCRKSQD